MAAAAEGRGAGIDRWRRGRHWLARRVGRSDRGASAVELAVLAPGLMMLCMLILQFGLWFNARQVAVAAAQAGATVARQEAASDPRAGRPTRRAPPRATTPACTRTCSPSIAPHAYGSPGSNVYVTVKGQLGYSVFPFFALNLNISATAGGPIECFRPAGQNGC